MVLGVHEVHGASVDVEETSVVLHSILLALLRVQFFCVLSLEARRPVDADTAQVARDAFADSWDAGEATVHPLSISWGGLLCPMPGDLCRS
jgi:hypothetical protein